MLSDHKGWILEAIIREAAIASSAPVNLVFIPNRKKSYLKIKDVIMFLRNRKPQGNCLFVNQNTYFKIVKDSIIDINPKHAYVFYTHYSELELNEFEQSDILSKCKKIYTMNLSDKLQLIKLGVSEDRIEVVYGGVNREIFYPQNSILPEPFVLITGDCKERKSPNLIFEVINKMKNVNFVIHGREWDKYCRHFKIIKPTNLKIINFDFKNNPQLMRNANVYLSLSKLEGGPYTTIEALASGTPVVVTSTGWNSEIVDDSNGVLLPLINGIDDVIAAIKKAIILKEKVRHFDLIEGKFSWKKLGQTMFY
jgi:glycosyltransferase involved in cell wall biosynthesis